MKASRVGPSGPKQKGTIKYGTRYSLNCMETCSWVRPAHRSNALCGTYLESIHGVLASYLFNEYTKENKLQPNTSYLDEIVQEILIREDAVVDYLFITDEMKINGIDRIDLKRFIRERVNFVCKEMNLPMYPISSTPSLISEWFFQGVNAISIHDFFTSGTHQYKRNWSETKLSRLPHIKDNHD